MQAPKTRQPRRLVPRPLIAALAASASCAAWAEDPSPWYIGASVDVTRDSNVYRVPDGPSDTYTTTSLLGGFDQAIGRQRIFATGRVGYNKYQKRDNLDNTSYGVTAGWDWATIEKLTGNVSASANRSLASLNGNSIRPSAAGSLVSNEQISTGVRWGGDGLWTLFGNYGYSRVSYSSNEFLTSEGASHTTSVGVNYRLGGSTTVGAAVRYTRTNNPYAVQLSLLPTGPEDYGPRTNDGRNIDLLADWNYSAQTKVSARLSFTNQSYSGGEDRDFSGLTGSLSASYAPTAKLAFNATLSRDAGNNATYFSSVDATSGSSTTTINENSDSSYAVTLGATYAATAKISVNAGGQYRRNTLSAGGSDSLTRASLGATYAVARNWQLGCNLSRESRSTSGGGSFSYDANIIGCSAQFTLR